MWPVCYSRETQTVPSAHTDAPPIHLSFLLRDADMADCHSAPRSQSHSLLSNDSSPHLHSEALSSENVPTPVPVPHCRPLRPLSVCSIPSNASFGFTTLTFPIQKQPNCVSSLRTLPRVLTKHVSADNGGGRGAESAALDSDSGKAFLEVSRGHSQLTLQRAVLR